MIRKFGKLAIMFILLFFAVQSLQHAKVHAENIVICEYWNPYSKRWNCEPNLGNYEFPMRRNRNGTPYYTITVNGTNLVIKGRPFNITQPDIEGHDNRVFVFISQLVPTWNRYFKEFDVHSEGSGETAQDSVIIPLSELIAAGINYSALTVDQIRIADREMDYIPCYTNADPARIECAQCSHVEGDNAACIRYSTCTGTGGCGNGMAACPKAPSCSCISRTCPPATPKSKFRTTIVSNGTSLTCTNANDCNPITAACAPSYVNSAPSCTITPATVSSTRGTGGTTFTITANDADYGDEVRITGFNVKDTAGNLNNCVTLQTAGGGAGLGATVKQGYPDSNPLTSQSNTFVANPDLMHGIYENVGGQSICSGKLTVEISDTVGDTPDTTNYASCSVNITMTNHAPTISNIKVLDQDSNPLVRETGNLINGSPLFIGSNMESKRASYCSAALSLSPLAECDVNNKVALASRKNPFSIEYTVTDSDGIGDIMQSGVWIQEEEQSPFARALPPAEGGRRKSIQALYSERENFQTTSGKWYFNSRACVGNTCSPSTLIGSPKLTFSAYSLIVRRDNIIPITAKASNSPYQASAYKQWLKVGFPDCFLTVTGCTDANVPTTSKTDANYVTSQFTNYDWIVKANNSSLVCYRTYAVVPEVIENADECPSGCAACAANMGVEQLSATQAVFKYKIFFNDRDDSTGQGMSPGPYRIFVNALDKVATPLQNAKIVDDDEAWLKFDRNGQICPSGSCSAGDFILNFDPIAPSIASVTWNSNDTNLTATVHVTENPGESGLLGGTNRFIARQAVSNGNPIGTPVWAKNTDGTTDFNGLNDHFVSSNTQTQMLGKGLLSGESVIAGMCVYDKAGNMSCGKNSTMYTFITSWLKTSLGDVYSNSSASASTAFLQTLPDTNDNTSVNNDTYVPLQPQSDTMATGVVSTATQNFGVNGGNLISGVNYPLGFANNYRLTTSSVFNITGLVSSHTIDSYSALSTLVANNCESMNELKPDTCKSYTEISATQADVPYKLVTVANTTLSNISCKNVNIIYIQGNVTISGRVTKETATSACAFIVANGATLTIGDTPSDARIIGPDALPAPSVDRFEAAVIATKGANVSIDKGVAGTSTGSLDRLEMKGLLYSADQGPLFKRTLLAADSKKYPAEWVIYDANLLESLRPILGLVKTADVVCGISNHILCGK